VADGGHEYTIRIEPSLVDVLKGGSELVSDVPEHIRVRRVRISVGTGALARIDGEPAEPAPDRAGPGAAPPAEIPDPVDAGGPAMPTRFDEVGAAAQPLAPPSDAGAAPAPHSAEKPRLDAGAGGADEASSRPWTPLVVAAALLACSLAANVFLGWIYVEARRRYRDAVGRMRAAPAG
jgi:hypothetical protein